MPTVGTDAGRRPQWGTPCLLAMLATLGGLLALLLGLAILLLPLLATELSGAP